MNKFLKWITAGKWPKEPMPLIMNEMFVWFIVLLLAVTMWSCDWQIGT